MNPTHTTPTDDVDVTPADLLRGAATYLARHGWTQAEMFDDPTNPTPAACAYGAIKMATCGGPLADYTDEQAADANRALRILAGYLDTVFYVWGVNCYGELAEPFDVVTDWNDDADRTALDVIAALNAAADEWDRLHAQRQPTRPVGQAATGGGDRSRPAAHQPTSRCASHRPDVPREDP
jgi:hypothetical protein